MSPTVASEEAKDALDVLIKLGGQIDAAQTDDLTCLPCAGDQRQWCLLCGIRFLSKSAVNRTQTTDVMGPKPGPSACASWSPI